MIIDFTPLKKWVFFIFVFLFTTKYTKDIRYFIFKGGRSSAKSWHVAMLFVKRSFYKDCDQIIFQKHLSGADKGTRKLITQTIKRFHLQSCFKIPISKYTITNTESNSCIEFSEFKDEDKIKGAEGFRHYWIDEADQCSEESMQKIDDTLRTFDDTTGIFTFNPCSPFIWLKTKFIDKVMGDENCINVEYSYFFIDGEEADEDDYDYYMNDAENNKEVKRLVNSGLWVSKKFKTIVHHSTYLVNPKLPINYIQKKVIERLENFTFWCVNDMGNFGSPEGLVFPNFEIKDFDYSQMDGCSGLDFGWTHPLVLIKSYISERDKTIYFWGEFAGSRITNEELASAILDDKEFNYGFIWADSAEPKTISYLKSRGVDIRGVNKSAVSVEEQIKEWQGYKIVSHSHNKIFNIQAYLYKYPPNGKKDSPLKENDDGYDAGRYSQHSWFAPSTKLKSGKAKGFM